MGLEGVKRAGRPPPPMSTRADARGTMLQQAVPHVLARRLLTHPRMTTLPPIGPLATAGAPPPAPIVGVDAPPFAGPARAPGGGGPAAAPRGGGGAPPPSLPGGGGL